MNQWSVLLAILKADFLERTRRYSFLVTLCLVLYLGYAVNTGQILIRLESYRGIYNSAWVGSLMALVITFFLGIFGFYLVKNSIARDATTGVGQIIATTPLTRPQYLFGKWLSNFAVLASMVAVLAGAAILMQLIQSEDAQIHVWALIAPFLFIALPMMALVAALAVFFETVSWLKGGFGNLVYFFVFIAMTVAGIFLTNMPWLDVSGISLVGTSMKAAAKAVFPTYNNSFVLGMVSEQQIETFVWQGLNWTPALVLERLAWVGLAAGVALAGSFFFNRFDPSKSTFPRRKKNSQPAADGMASNNEPSIPKEHPKQISLTPLANKRFYFNFLRLTWLECLLLVKGLKWYWIAIMALLWIGCIASPSEGIRKYWFMLAGIWPVLVWSKIGERETRYQVESLILHAAHPLARIVLSSWLAGVLLTAALESGVLLGRIISAETVDLIPWLLSVVFIPTLALTLGVWSQSSKLFEVIYPILWYLGPFNAQNELTMLDYLGIHSQAPIHTFPLEFAGLLIALVLLSLAGRKLKIAY